MLATGLSFAFVGLVGNLDQKVLESGALASPINALTFSVFFHGIRLFGGEIGSRYVTNSIRTCLGFT